MEPYDDRIRVAIATMQATRERIADIERQLAEKQAEIDRLMMEFCPEEMTKEQIENWGRNQRPSRKQP